MAYLYGTETGNEAVREFLEQWAPEAPDEVKEKGAKLEHHASSFNDPGDDWNEYRVFDVEGQKIWSVRKSGY